MTVPVWPPIILGPRPFPFVQSPSFLGSRALYSIPVTHVGVLQMALARRFAAVLALLALPAVYAENPQYTLYHRLYHISEPQGHFQQRATLTISQNNSVSFHPAPSFADDISAFADDLKQVKNKDLLLYQVALEREGDKKEEHWDISSVKAVRVRSSGPVWFRRYIPIPVPSH